MDFLQKWTHDHVKASPIPFENDGRVAKYAQECEAEASNQGIPLLEIEEDMGSIAEYIYEALGDASADAALRLAKRGD